MAIRDIIRPIRSGPAICTTRMRMRGNNMLAPSPCTTRKAMRLPMDQAAPERTEPSRKRLSEAVQQTAAP